MQGGGWFLFEGKERRKADSSQMGKGVKVGGSCIQGLGFGDLGTGITRPGRRSLATSLGDWILGTWLPAWARIPVPPAGHGSTDVLAFWAFRGWSARRFSKEHHRLPFVQYPRSN